MFYVVLIFLLFSFSIQSTYVRNAHALETIQENQAYYETDVNPQEYNQFLMTYKYIPTYLTKILRRKNEEPIQTMNYRPFQSLLFKEIHKQIVYRIYVLETYLKKHAQYDFIEDDIYQRFEKLKKIYIDYLEVLPQFQEAMQKKISTKKNHLGEMQKKKYLEEKLKLMFQSKETKIKTIVNELFFLITSYIKHQNDEEIPQLQRKADAILKVFFFIKSPTSFSQSEKKKVFFMPCADVAIL